MNGFIDAVTPYAVLLEPHIMEAIIAVALFLAQKIFRDRFTQDTLHRALSTGVYAIREALRDGRISKEEAIDFVISYAKTSSPKALSKAPKTVQVEMAIAKIAEIVGM